MKHLMFHSVRFLPILCFLEWLLSWHDPLLMVGLSLCVAQTDQGSFMFGVWFGSLSEFDLCLLWMVWFLFCDLWLTCVYTRMAYLVIAARATAGAFCQPISLLMAFIISDTNVSKSSGMKLTMPFTCEIAAPVMEFWVAFR